MKLCLIWSRLFVKKVLVVFLLIVWYILKVSSCLLGFMWLISKGRLGLFFINKCWEGILVMCVIWSNWKIRFIMVLWRKGFMKLMFICWRWKNFMKMWMGWKVINIVFYCLVFMVKDCILDKVFWFILIMESF